MFENQSNGECGSLVFMLRNLVSTGPDGLRLNLRWRHLSYVEFGEFGAWQYESIAHGVLRIIKSYRAARVALALAAVGDVLIWASVIF